MTCLREKLPTAGKVFSWGRSYHANGQNRWELRLRGHAVLVRIWRTTPAWIAARKLREARAWLRQVAAA